MSLLVLGGTGTLGRQIVRKALDEGFQVKCFVRSFRKASFLKEWGAELVYGDLRIAETIPLTLFGVTAIIDASTARPTDSYNTSQIDLYSKYILIESAKQANIERYIFFSILNARKYPNIPLMNLKVKVENRLQDSSLNYTIFTLGGFFQGLIRHYALPILDNQTIWLTGDTTSIAYMDTQDIAKFTIRSLSLSQANRKILPLVGNSSWTSLQVIELCEKLSGQRSKISQVPIYLLKIACELTNLFQWSWNISERLAFTEVINRGDNFNASMNEVYNLLQIQNDETTQLESYLQEYFAKVMKKLKELNYKMGEESSTIEF